jgi:regulator of sigma E protease
MDVVYSVVLVGVLIFVHELGHFAWAKFFDVKVLRFSLGFGPKLFGIRRGETEYVVAAIPLGGYVKMLGEGPNDAIPAADASRAFGAQSIGKRFLIVVAGPAMNLLFPLALFFVVHLGDETMVPAVVGTVYPHRPADGRLVSGDRVVAIDGTPVHTYDRLSRVVGASAGQPLRFEVERGGAIVEVEVTPVLTHTVRELDRVQTIGRIGVLPYEPLPVVGVTSPRSPASAGDGLRTFDVVVSAKGQPIDRWSDLERAIEGNRGASVPVTYLRPRALGAAGEPRPLGGLADVAIYDARVAIITPEPGPGSAVLRAGIEPADLYVARVRPGSPEQRMGVRAGDRLVALDGRPIRLWATFLADLRAGGGREHELTWRHGDTLKSGRFKLRHIRWVDEFGQRIDRYEPGIAPWLPVRTQPPVANPAPVRHAASRAVERTLEMVEITGLSAVRLVQGRLTVKSIGGPITIFAEAGTAARRSTFDYLTLMAFLSINLGLINLLPIPLLDGGHLLFLGTEAVMRRPPSLRVRQYASLAGFAILVLLMLLAIKNDVERHWPSTHVVAEVGEQ